MKYISFYDTEKNRRAMCVAAVNKINYIAGALNRIGVNVEIVSASMIADKKIDKCTEKLFDNTNIFYFKTSKTSKNKLKRIYNVFRQSIKLFLYLITNVKKDEEILVYHSLGLMRSVYLAKKIKKFRLILEVEEIYNDVRKKSKASIKMEQKFIDCADKYIFPTELLNEKINFENKPYVINCGVYQEEKIYDETFNDDKIHVVYAGTFDSVKGGITIAEKIGAYLTSDYHIHILGFGSKSEIEQLKKNIDDINTLGKGKVTYEGLLLGKDFIRFLQKCHIGLSTQNPKEKFNDTSFPSKILTYMSNGLRVVTVRIPVIERSDINSEMYYYDGYEAVETAKAIMNIDLNDNYDGRSKIKELDKKFCEDLKELI